jgi:acetyl-CoA carboxylase carboxyl transferase subunit beta
VLEETGLDVEIGEQVIVAELGGGYVAYDFIATVTGGSLRPGDDADDAMWFTTDELDDLDVSPGLLDELRRAGLL